MLGALVKNVARDVLGCRWKIEKVVQVSMVERGDQRGDCLGYVCEIQNHPMPVEAMSRNANLGNIIMPMQSMAFMRLGQARQGMRCAE